MSMSHSKRITMLSKERYHLYQEQEIISIQIHIMPKDEMNQYPQLQIMVSVLPQEEPLLVKKQISRHKE